MKLHAARKVETLKPHGFEVADIAVWMPLSKLVAPPHQRPRRTDHNSPDLKRLHASISDIGQVVPIQVVQPPPLKQRGLYEVSDGNRRWEVQKMLKATHIKAFISHEDSGRLFAHLVEGHKSCTAHDRLGMFLENPDTVNDFIRSALTNMVKLIGRPLAKKMERHGFTLATFTQAKRIARYCNLSEEAKFIKMTLNWLIDRNQTLAARFFMDSKSNPHTLICAILDNKTLCDC